MNLTDQSDNWPCNDEMEQSECYYKLRRYDTFDLSIENVAKDSCIVCYGVGPDLWPIHQAQLMKRLTRSDGDKLIHYEDCSPKTGYHKSRYNEVYRCEGGNDEVGVMAFTKASGDSYYDCGFQHFDWEYYDQHWQLNAADLLHNRNKFPIFTVSVFSYF